MNESSHRLHDNKPDLPVWLEQAEKLLAVSLLISLVAGALVRMLLRNFGTSVLAIQTSGLISLAIPHLVLVLGLLGTSIGLLSEKVIKIELIRKVSPSFERYKGILLYFIVIIVMGIYIFSLFRSAEFGDASVIYFVYIPLFILITLKAALKTTTYMRRGQLEN